MTQVTWTGGEEHWTDKGDARLFMWHRKRSAGTAFAGTLFFVHGSSMASQPTFDLSVLFFLQLAVIVATCRVSGWVFRYFGQPQVVSEMIAGVLLGPSLLGWLAPEVSAALFPPASKPILFSVCQLGLVLYMFLIGVEFDFELIRSRLRSAAAGDPAHTCETTYLLGDWFLIKNTPDEAATAFRAAADTCPQLTMPRVAATVELKRLEAPTPARSTGSAGR